MIRRSPNNTHKTNLKRGFGRFFLKAYLKWGVLLIFFGLPLPDQPKKR